MHNWIPTESDCQWTRGIISNLSLDGIWCTSFGVFKRTDVDTLTLVFKIVSPTYNTNVEIDKVKKAVETIGWKFLTRSDVLSIALPFDIMGFSQNGKNIVAYTDDGKKTQININKCSRCGFWYNEDEHKSCPYCKV